MSKKTCTLPKKMSALIKIALADLAKVERSKKFYVNMGTWLQPPNSDVNTCEVCLAGSVMAKTCKLDETPPKSNKNWPAFFALNSLRIGNVSTAARDLDLSYNKRNKATELDRYVPEYAHDPKEFRRAMNNLRKDLEKAGL